VTAVEGDCDTVVGLEALVEPELSVYGADLDGIAVDTMGAELPKVPG